MRLLSLVFALTSVIVWAIFDDTAYVAKNTSEQWIFTADTSSDVDTLVFDVMGINSTHTVHSPTNEVNYKTENSFIPILNDANPPNITGTFAKNARITNSMPDDTSMQSANSAVSELIVVDNTTTGGVKIVSDSYTTSGDNYTTTNIPIDTSNSSTNATISVELTTADVDVDTTKGSIFSKIGKTTDEKTTVMTSKIGKTTDEKTTTVMTSMIGKTIDETTTTVMTSKIGNTTDETTTTVVTSKIGKTTDEKTTTVMSSMIGKTIDETTTTVMTQTTSATTVMETKAVGSPIISSRPSTTLTTTSATKIMSTFTPTVPPESSTLNDSFIGVLKSGEQELEDDNEKKYDQFILILVLWFLAAAVVTLAVGYVYYDHRRSKAEKFKGATTRMNRTRGVRYGKNLARKNSKKPRQIEAAKLNMKEFKRKGPLVLQADLRGDVKHQLDEDKSTSLKGLAFDPNQNSLVWIGTEVEKLEGQTPPRSSVSSGFVNTTKQRSSSSTAGEKKRSSEPTKPTSSSTNPSKESAETIGAQPQKSSKYEL